MPLGPSRREMGARHSASAAELMEKGKWPAAERRLLRDLSGAERREDIASCAECRANLGHVAEAQQRIGDAVRHWSVALALLDKIGHPQDAEVERVARLIRRWHELPRVWISYAHADGKRVAQLVKVLKQNDDTPVPAAQSDDVRIMEGRLGFKPAATLLVNSLKKSVLVG